MCNTHAVFVVPESTNVDWNTILQSLQAEQYVGFINLPADLNDWLPESINIEKSKYVCIIMLP